VNRLTSLFTVALVVGIPDGVALILLYEARRSPYWMCLVAAMAILTVVLLPVALSIAIAASRNWGRSESQ
jgi:hypothetical protein